MSASEPIRLHLGCGARFIPGFIHVDVADFPHIDHRHPVNTLPMFDDESVELIYASHVFEYFDRTEAPKVLSEWRRVLRPGGGTLRHAVPDWEAIIAQYAQDGKLDACLGPLYGRMVVAGSTGPLVLYHKTVYDFESLRQVLVASGFRDVRRYDWRATIHAGHDDFSQAYLPHMDKERGRLLSLNVECVKQAND
jgi:predicted SAM-dependent methyltransferase